MQRLQRIGKPLEPTLDVADGSVDADDLAKRLRSLPLPEAPAHPVLTPRPTVLDGERYGLVIDANLSRLVRTSDDARWPIDDQKNG
jgi:hypothetical protein